MKFSLLISLSLFSLLTHAKVEVLFHPHDQSLERIAEWIGESESQIDIAMYNMDVTDASPVIQKLKSADMQRKLRDGHLKIRLIFEGYGTPESNHAKMGKIEDLGIDVRFLGKDVKVHHKFAVIDTGSTRERVITGSANWSLSSYRNYNENILFFDNEPEPSRRYQEEFNRLWSQSSEFGSATVQDSPSTQHTVDQPDLEIHFNSPRHLNIDADDGVYLTDQVVRLIDKAQSEVDVATTRIRLEPILDAVARAAQRGVQVRIVINQDDYRDLYRRSRWLFSSSNIRLRVKFYNIKVTDYMAYQMHNKFMIVDRSSILTGSFNWSRSSEENHIENLVELSGSMAGQLLPDFNSEFEMIWNLGRTELERLNSGWAKAKAKGEQRPCGFGPVSLEIKEIKFMVREYKNCRKKD